MCLQKLYELPRFQYKFNLYFTWYEDKNCKIGFSDIPSVCQIPINKFTMTNEEIAAIKKKPFIIINHIGVYLEDKKKNKIYTFMIPPGYCYDGASIPRMFWRLIGSKEDVRFLIAALVHDMLCEHHCYVDNDRYFADKIFERNLFVAGVPAPMRWTMFHSVDNFQKFCNWGSK